MQYAELPSLRDVLPGFRSRADRLDRSGDWPEDDLRVLAHIGAMRWAEPMEFGGEYLSPIELHFRYEAVASASLAVALILSQRDSAVGFIEAADGWPRRAEILHRLANDELFTTVGIAQLTTSRQGGPPALRASAVDNGFRIDGIIPWCTGAAHADFVVAGAAFDDGKQILFGLPTDLPGVKVEPPGPLAALRATWTSRITCDGAIVPHDWLIRGPTDKALGTRKQHLTLGQVFLGMGLCQGALNLIAEHDSDRARAAHRKLDAQLHGLRDEVMDLSAPGREADAAEASPRIRGECNELALRITHTAVTLYKGTALLADHPAQRLAREALFLLVWSCPDPVIDCTVELLTGGAT